MTWENLTEAVLDQCMDTFGVGTDGKFTFIGHEGAETQVRGIFDTAYIGIDPNTNAPVQSTGPALGAKLSELPRYPTSRDKVRVKDVLYAIEHVEKDVHGGVTLFLQRLS
jgi:hypothetical protein